MKTIDRIAGIYEQLTEALKAQSPEVMDKVAPAMQELEELVNQLEWARELHMLDDINEGRILN